MGSSGNFTVFCRNVDHKPDTALLQSVGDGEITADFFRQILCNGKAETAAVFTAARHTEKAREQAVAVLLTDAVAVVADNNLHFIRIAGVQRDFGLAVRRQYFTALFRILLMMENSACLSVTTMQLSWPSKENSIFLRRA